MVQIVDPGEFSEVRRVTEWKYVDGQFILRYNRELWLNGVYLTVSEHDVLEQVEYSVYHPTYQYETEIAAQIPWGLLVAPICAYLPFSTNVCAALGISSLVLSHWYPLRIHSHTGERSLKSILMNGKYKFDQDLESVQAAITEAQEYDENYPGRRIARRAEHRAKLESLIRGAPENIEPQ